MDNVTCFDIFVGKDYSRWKVHVIPFPVVCGTSHNSSRLKSYGHVKLENPHDVNSNLVQYLLQTDIQKRTEKIQWQIQTLHRVFSPGNPNWENQHILYSYIVLHCLQYNIHI
jgi:hypothetical protein